MSEKEEEENPASPPARVGKSRSGGALLMIVLPGLLAGAAAFGGAKLSTPRTAVPPPGASEKTATPEPPPGPTLSLEPFLVVIQDSAKKSSHAMKLTMAVEFDEKAREETLKSFIPRIRDAALNRLRSLSYDDALDREKTDKLRTELLDRFRLVGAEHAERVLITDLVLQ